MTKQETKNLMNEILRLEETYDELVRSGKDTEKAICDLYMPLRDKYNFTDLQALDIVMGRMSIFEIGAILSKNESEE